MSDWAMYELGAVDLGDKRLDKRAVKVLQAMSGRPDESIPNACGGRAEIGGAYRFFDNPKATFQKVLDPHIQKTMERMKQQDVVVVAHDSTEIDLTRPQQQVEGAGHLDGSRRGLMLHEVQAFTISGTPLGTAWAKPLIRTEVSHEPKSAKIKRWKQMPIEQKESGRWLEGFRQVREMAEQMPGVQVINVMDSEADIYEVIAEPRGRTDWVIRSCHDRALEGDGNDELKHVMQKVLAAPVLYKAKVAVRGRVAQMPQDQKRQRKRTRRSRAAVVEVRAVTVTLRPPRRGDRELPAMQVNVVLVREKNPPEGEPAVEWLLLTTLPIKTRKQVRQVVEYYKGRWSIEVFFHTLKSGCKVERRFFEDVSRLLPCLSLCLTMAWRTLFTCRMAQECPDADCELLFEPSEWKAVWKVVRRTDPPRTHPRLRQMVELIAQLGGYIPRRNGRPGPKTTWIGLRRMYDFAAAWDLFGPGSAYRRPPRCV